MFDYSILDKAIEEFGNEEKSLIAILQCAQEHYRYLWFAGTDVPNLR